MIYLDIVNQVLIKLREDQVSSVTDTEYSTLIGSFVNDTKQETEDAWNWGVLRDTISVSTSTSNTNLTLTGTNKRTRILDIINDDQDVVLRRVNNNRFNRLLYQGATQEAAPVYWRPRGLVSGERRINLWPIPDATYTIRAECVIPQDDLSANMDDLILPEKMVIYGAWARAISERGEDGGAIYDEVMGQYKNFLSDAIAIDQRDYDDEETTWMPS